MKVSIISKLKVAFTIQRRIFITYIIESRLIWKNCLLNNMWTTTTGYRIISKPKKLMFLFTVQN